MRYRVSTSNGKTATFYEAFDAVQWAAADAVQWSAAEIYIQDIRQKVDELTSTGKTAWSNGSYWARIDRVD